ncbi:HAD family hydrolase [Thalassospira lucentensis]|uniref:HAD family hydrolase n=1 Tax=Thalassospira lucentensis TaxID=168935 RepID=UPI00399D5F9F
MTKTPNIQLVVCDLDNTIYDWVAYFVPSFYAMIDESVTVLDCSKELLLDEMRDVHRRHHDSEHPFALLDTSIVKSKFKNSSRSEIANRLDSALHRFNSMRKQSLHLYEGVEVGIQRLKSQNIKIVAHTESKLFTTLDRLKRLKVLQLFDHVYCLERPKSVHPHKHSASEWLDKFDLSIVTELAHEDRKPAPHVLQSICEDLGISPQNTAYIGDSIAKDIVMAKNANVFAIWAKYGTEVAPELYSKLVRISHWTEADVAREVRLKENAQGVEPDLTVLSFFEAVQKITQ